MKILYPKGISPPRGLPCFARGAASQGANKFRMTEKLTQKTFVTFCIKSNEMDSGINLP